MPDLVTAICACEITGDGAPEWVHLLPLGVMKARDGRTFDLANPDAVVQVFNAGGVDLPVDYEHQSERAEARNSGPVPAAGWIKALQVRGDGIWGRVVWTKRARDMIASREYRYLSPAILYNQPDRKIIRLKGAGLVHNPALHLTALANQEDTMADENLTFMQRVSDLLGLPEGTDENTIFEELAALLEKGDKPDPRKFAPVEALNSLLRDRNAHTATMSQERAQSKVDAAFKVGYLTTAMKGWATDLCMVDEAAFDRFLETSAPPFAHLVQRSHTAGAPPGTEQTAIMSDAAKAVCAQLGLDPKALIE